MAIIADMMRRLEWERGKSAIPLAEKWGLAVNTVERDAVEASRRVKSEMLNPEGVGIDVGVMLTQVAKMHYLSDDPKMVAVAVKAADTLARLVGSMAPVKTEMAVTATALPGQTPLNELEAEEQILRLAEEIQARRGLRALPMPVPVDPAPSVPDGELVEVDESHEMYADEGAAASTVATGERVLVAGGPRCGKSTFAKRLVGNSGIKFRSTDDLLGTTDWSGGSAKVSEWFNEPGPWVIEGVTVPRAIRKWLAGHPTGTPCDVVYWFDRPFCELSAGQTSMRKGCQKVWGDVERELVARGVRVERP